MEEKRFRIVFSGEFLPGRDPALVRRKLVEEQGLSPEKANLIFSGKKVVLKENADRDSAMQIKNAFLAAGALCRVEAMGQDLPPKPRKDAPQDGPPQEKAAPRQQAAPQKQAALPQEDDSTTDSPPDQEDEQAPMPRPAFGISARSALDFAIKAIQGQGSGQRSPEEEEDFRLFQAMITGALVTGLITLIVVGKWAAPQVALLLGLSLAQTLTSMAIFLAIVFCGVRFGWKALVAAAVIGAFLVQIITANRLSLPGLTVVMAVFPGILLVCTIAGALPGAAAGFLMWEAGQKKPEDPKDPENKDEP
ncbi:MAG: hypothetical protein QMD09_06245 [Desulfatibacillaceae bacterium]|nr:hypothetical protein [Desulfatibacillaceae bacterium]